MAFQSLCVSLTTKCVSFLHREQQTPDCIRLLCLVEVLERFLFLIFVTWSVGGHHCSGGGKTESTTSFSGLLKHILYSGYYHNIQPPHTQSLDIYMINITATQPMRIFHTYSKYIPQKAFRVDFGLVENYIHMEYSKRFNINHFCCIFVLCLYGSYTVWWMEIKSGLLFCYKRVISDIVEMIKNLRYI